MTSNMSLSYFLKQHIVQIQRKRYWTKDRTHSCSDGKSTDSPHWQAVTKTFETINNELKNLQTNNKEWPTISMYLAGKESDRILRDKKEEEAVV